MLGGMRFESGAVRRWRWAAGERLSEPVRCRAEQWYMIRAQPNGDGEAAAGVQAEFDCGDGRVAARHVQLAALNGDGGELLGWVQAPAEATHVRIGSTGGRASFSQLDLHVVAERDAKCHPTANVPRWSTYRPAFEIEKVCLPESLEMLADVVPGERLEFLSAPRSAAALAGKIRRRVCVIDPDWVRRGGWGVRDLRALAVQSWIITDLDTAALMLRRSGRVEAKVAIRKAPHEIMSARVVYADVPTRGFALLDVFPFSIRDERSGFCVRVIEATRAWKRFADQAGFATLLASETPWASRSGDVISAAMPVERGEWIVTDLPWVCAEIFGPLLAPRVARHALRMHLGEPLPEGVQYWNRWDEAHIVLRDISDMARKFAPLAPVRWAGVEPRVAQLGLTLPTITGGDGGPHLMIRTGRIDQTERHDGLPAEPMIILMRWLARERREGTQWAAAVLRDATLTWQFDAADGLKYAMAYEAPRGAAARPPDAELHVSWNASEPLERTRLELAGGPAMLRLCGGGGVLGDGSLEVQARLLEAVCGWVERSGSRGRTTRA